MATTKGHRHREPGRHKDHAFHDTPPQQEKFTIPGGREESPSTAKPFDHPDIVDQPGISQVLHDVEGCNEYGRPSYGDMESSHIHRSLTNGKR